MLAAIAGLITMKTEITGKLRMAKRWKEQGPW
jgi:hypothetical protein